MPQVVEDVVWPCFAALSLNRRAYLVHMPVRSATQIASHRIPTRNFRPSRPIFRQDGRVARLHQKSGNLAWREAAILHVLAGEPFVPQRVPSSSKLIQRNGPSLSALANFCQLPPQTDTKWQDGRRCAPARVVPTCAFPYLRQVHAHVPNRHALRRPNPTQPSQRRPLRMSSCAAHGCVE